jgi:uncharacterized membrane protein
MAWVLTGLCLVGIAISSFFTGVAYHWVRPDTRWIPAVCRMGEQTCATIVFTPRARVFGVPNSVLGQLFYVTLAIVAITGGLDAPLVRLAVLGASGVTVVLGLYLTYSLLFVTRVNCVLCFTSHALNLVLFVLLLW